MAWENKQPDFVQSQLVKVDESWRKDWNGMPEYKQEDLRPFKTIYVHFENREDYLEFSRLLSLTKMTMSTRGVWFPETDVDKSAKLAWVDANDDRVRRQVERTGKGGGASQIVTEEPEVEILDEGLEAIEDDEFSRMFDQPDAPERHDDQGAPHQNALKQDSAPLDAVLAAPEIPKLVLPVEAKSDDPSEYTWGDD